MDRIHNNLAAHVGNIASLDSGQLQIARQKDILDLSNCFVVDTFDDVISVAHGYSLS
jgi:hypothetical protein